MTDGAPRPADPAQRFDSDALLAVVGEVAGEVRSGSAATAEITLDSALEKDLGLDSLARVELLLRIQQRFDVNLPDSALGNAETPRDLWAALCRAAPGAGAATAPAGIEPRESLEDVPRSAGTLTEVLQWYAARHPDVRHVALIGDDGSSTDDLTHADLHGRALAIAAALQTRGLGIGACVAIMLPTGVDYLSSFFGVLYAGAIPVPIYPPLRPNQIEDHLRRHAGILNNAQADMLVTVAQARQVSRLLQGLVPTLRATVTADELRGAQPLPEPVTRAPGDIAFLQYTSGSTGNPKGVVLTHSDLLANIRIMGTAIGAGPADVFVSWLPLYHDMGLIGAWLGSLYFGLPLVLMSPLTFLARPSRWLWAIHRYRGTLSAGPNFSYELCLAKVADEEIEGLDLSSWRLAFNGAEPVSAQTVRGFTRRFAEYGFGAQAMAPVYGLAECAVGLAFPPLEREPRVECVDRERLERSGEARACPDHPQGLQLVGCGFPLPGYEVRVVDEQDRELPERHQGRLQFRGPSATSGYYRNPQATRALFRGDWLESGDLAYIAGGEIFITSRIKDLIIRGGRNVHPYELEQAVGELQGVRRGCVAAFGGRDAARGTERLVVVAETRETDEAARGLLHKRVQQAAVDLLGMPADDIVLAPPHSVLKTSSGKIRRAATRDLYEQGTLGKAPRRLWWQVIRVGVSVAGTQARATRRWLGARLFAAYGWSLFGVLAFLVWCGAFVLPTVGSRWALARWCMGALARASGTPLRVEGSERMPRPPFVLVSNHQSYLDAPVLAAALPQALRFVAKAELANQFFAGTFLRRMGALFVERADVRRSAAAARELNAVLAQGGSVAVFAEGTFDRTPGLRGFRAGAFAAAAQAGVPVVPVTLVGTRSMLRSGSWFPRPGAVRVTVDEPISPEGRDWQAALQLRDRVRAAILARCGEPDRADIIAGPE